METLVRDLRSAKTFGKAGLVSRDFSSRELRVRFDLHPFEMSIKRIYILILKTLGVHFFSVENR